MPQTNDLLEALSAASKSQILAIAKHTELPQRTVLSQPDEVPSYFYLLTSGFAANVVSVADGATAEIGIFGCEGMVGAPSLLGSSRTVSHCTMQVDGTGYRIPYADMKRLFQEAPDVHAATLQCVQAQWLSLSQIAACNRLHDASERLARWLLTAADHADSGAIGLTQETLSQMLGTRRTTVALIAGSLQREGLIRYQRGMIRVTNREALENAACDCYGVTRRLTANMYKDGNGKQ